MVDVLCPKCQKHGKFSYFGMPDETDIIAGVFHDYRTVTTPFGSHETPGRRCFLKTDDFTDEIRQIIESVVSSDGDKGDD